MKDDATILFHAPSEVKRAVLTAAAENGMTQRAVIETAIRQYLNLPGKVEPDGRRHNGGARIRRKG